MSPSSKVRKLRALGWAVVSGVGYVVAGWGLLPVVPVLLRRDRDPYSPLILTFFIAIGAVGLILGTVALRRALLNARQDPIV